MRINHRLLFGMLLRRERTGIEDIRSIGKMYHCGLFEAVQGYKIHYMRAGSGAHNLLLFPGPMGSVVTDYSLFLDRLDKKTFTAVGWDPPGQGGSIPPTERSWLQQPGRLQEDAHLALGLMRQLNLVPFSLLGWAEGAITALITVANCEPNEFRKLVLWAHEGAIPCVQANLIDQTQDPRAWPLTCRAPLEAMYDSNYLAENWTHYTWAKNVGYFWHELSDPLIKGRLTEQFSTNSGPLLLLMRAPGRLNTEDWLTYLLAQMDNVRIINWMNQENDIKSIEKYACWGPHRADPDEFQAITEHFLRCGQVKETSEKL
ncbi:Valacyclovir hydrolase [Clonorchis sinensis]|uniref:Valacyclovir hydrolase n=1 Tax=Clonorchis sinensis TaxID=79923 RepID=A0A3R7C5P6_CLOSI|nr:Valacyclovir hydrolase [Clonorchis sinensis]